MLERTQIQAIADRLTGLDPQVRVSEMGDPFRSIYERITPGAISGMGIEGALWAALRGVDNANALARVILDAMPAGLVDFRSLEDLAGNLDPVDWLWEQWIPRGMLSLLGASPGAGKSLVALDLARRIIHGDGFPDGSPVENPGRPVVYVDAEAIPQVQNDRAVAWGMDRSKLYLLLPPEAYGCLDFGLEEHQDRLIEMCHQLRPELVVVDSLGSISVRGENNVEDVRHLLSFLSAVAREYQTGMLLIHHLRKRGPLPAADLVGPDDFRGSGHIIAMARSVLALSTIQAGPEPDRNGPRRMEIVKTNLCRHPKPLGLVFDDNGELQAPVLRYSLDAPKLYREPTQTEECAAWLVDALEEHKAPMKPKDVFVAALDAGFKDGVVRLARRSLKGIVVNTEKAKNSKANMWALAEWLDGEGEDL